MKKLLAHIIAGLIPFRNMRRMVRNRLLKKKPPSDYERILQRLYSIEHMLKASFPVTQVPPATGDWGLMHKTSLCVMSVFAKIMEKHNIKYWLDGGTLIGHIRHNGFIPWDYDLDLTMMRDDYEKIHTILDEEFSGNGFHYSRAEIIRLGYKDSPALVEIVPVDSGYCVTVPTGQEHDDFKKSLVNIRQDVYRDFEKLKKQAGAVSITQMKSILFDHHKTLVPQPLVNGFMFYGIELWWGMDQKSFWLYDDVFPLKPVEFCGIKTFIPNDSDFYLRVQYGDYMNWPDSITSLYPEIIARLTNDNYKECRRLIQEYLPNRTNSSKKTLTKI